MNLRLKVYNILSSKLSHKLLILGVALSGIIIFMLSSKLNFPDEKGYLFMGESILHGKFSSWYFFADYYPETLRTPGYPIFLALCQTITKSILFVKIVQLFLYFASVFLCLQIISKLENKLIYKNLFLILVILNIQIVYYTGLISTETLTIFFTILMVRLLFIKKNIINAIFLALSCYVLFIIKPAFLLFPFFLLIYFIFERIENIRYSLVFIVTFLILLLPFSLWNKTNHNQFNPNPIEGGGGVAHLGYWQLKLPDGYTERFYWGNTTAHDLTKPAFYTEEEYAENVLLYESEMTKVVEEIAVYNTTKDSANLVLMDANNPGIFRLYNSAYTAAREDYLGKLTFQHITENPVYYLKSRAYHFIRFYITGVNYKKLNESISFRGKFENIYPFVVTSLFIFLGLFLSTVYILLNRFRKFINFLPLLALCWYIGGVHIPFAIQSRYTIPVHLIILIIVSFSFIKFSKLNHGK